MKKLVLAGMIVATSLFAEAPVDNQNQVKNWQHKQIKKHHRINKRNFMSLVRNLGITPAQRKQIREIFKANRKNRIKNPNPLALSIKNGRFDKESYIKTRTSLCEKNIQKRAEIISKIYAILTPAQKTKIEALINAKRKK
jgi:Spy/CpxP family protein refolding chaperone